MSATRIERGCTSTQPAAPELTATVRDITTLSVCADTLLAIHEGEQDGDVWFAKSIEVRINDDKSVAYLSECKVDFPLPEGNKKGWEGAEYVDKGDEGEFLLGVCEGNHCQVSPPGVGVHGASCYYVAK